jgi:ATP phosphoribosyltransferase
VRLNGSIELAPLLGLSDVIVDIVETGATLRANGLVVVERFADISARLIANKSGYKFKTDVIERIREGLKEGIKESHD